MSEVALYGMPDWPCHMHIRRAPYTLLGTLGLIYDAPLDVTFVWVRTEPYTSNPKPGTSNPEPHKSHSKSYASNPKVPNSL